MYCNERMWLKGDEASSCIHVPSVSEYFTLISGYVPSANCCEKRRPRDSGTGHLDSSTVVSSSVVDTLAIHYSGVDTSSDDNIYFASQR